MTKFQSYFPCCTYCLTVLLSSFRSTPRIARSLSLNLSYRCFISGISILQNVHHVAQKLTHSGLPLKEDSLTDFPLYKSFNWKSGAMEPTLTAGTGSYSR